MFAREGPDVAVIDRLADDAERVDIGINRLGIRGFAFGADVADVTSITKALRGAEAQLGLVDVLMNNAGIDTHVPLADMTVATCDEMIAVNLRSVFLCTRAVLPGMIERRWGRNVSTSSSLPTRAAFNSLPAPPPKLACPVIPVRWPMRSRNTISQSTRFARDQINTGHVMSVRRNEGPETFRAPARALRRGRGSRPTAVLIASDERLLLHRRLVQHEWRRRDGLAMGTASIGSAGDLQPACPYLTSDGNRSGTDGIDNTIETTDSAAAGCAACIGWARPMKSAHDGNASSWVRTALRIAAARPSFAAGYIIVAVAVLMGVLAPLIAPYNPIDADPSQFLQSPNRLHWLGTDAVGMDILSRILYAPRIDITIAALGTMISATVGSLTGAWIGYYSRPGNFRSRIAFVLMRLADVLQAFPVFVFAIALVASLGQSIQTVVFAIAFVNIPIYMRLMRAQVMTIREMRFVEASLVAGMSDMRTILRHVMPNAMGPVLAQLSVNVGWSILLTAGLSFVGAGVRAPSPEWGSMIATGFQNVVTGEWWPSVFPGLALAITVFGFSLVGNSVEVFGDPVKARRLVRDMTIRAGDRAARSRP